MISLKGYFIDPSTGDKSSSRLCAFLAVLVGLGVSCFLAFKGHVGETVTLLGLILGTTWGGYTANSVSRVITENKTQPGSPSPGSKAVG